MQKVASFAERLVFRRNRLNVTQEALAQKSGVSQRSITDYEQGKAAPTMRQVEKLAAALEISPAWLVGGTDPNYEIPILKEEEPLPYRTGTIDLSVLSTEALQALFKSLAAQLPESEEPERTRILAAINSVNAERRHRKPHKLIKPPLSSEEQQKLLAAGLKHAGIGTQASGDSSESGQPSGADAPPSHKPQPPGASGHPTKAPRPARGEQD